MQLGLEKPLVAGFSCWGILALEVAKRLKDVSGVVLVSTPPAWNAQTIDFAQKYFEAHADATRLANHAQRQAHFAKVRKPEESLVSVNAYEGDAARYFYDFNVSRDFIEALWQGSEADDRAMKHFFGTVLPQHDVTKDLDKISCPVVLIAGQYDFDSTPIPLWQRCVQPSNFTIVECAQSAHWPHLEESAFFDDALTKWLRV
jgi:pimeloyl-ACP methyl ester carboxylesterase